MMILDRMNELGPTDPLFSFALDELLCRRAGHGGPAVCHIWRHPQAFVLGSQDLRLPYVREAMEWLGSNGWPVAVRNSGGAAVPLERFFSAHRTFPFWKCDGGRKRKDPLRSRRRGSFGIFEPVRLRLSHARVRAAHAHGHRGESAGVHGGRV